MNKNKYSTDGKLINIRNSFFKWLKSIPLKVKFFLKNTIVSGFKLKLWPTLKYQLGTSLAVFLFMFLVFLSLKHVDGDEIAANKILFIIYYSPWVLLIYSFVVGYFVRAVKFYKKIGE